MSYYYTSEGRLYLSTNGENIKYTEKILQTIEVMKKDLAEIKRVSESTSRDLKEMTRDITQNFVKVEDQFNHIDRRFEKLAIDQDKLIKTVKGEI